MIEVRELCYEELTKVEQDKQPDNGSGKEYAGYIKVIVDNETTGLYSDAMEPEDVSFYRDLKWVKSAIKDAYNAGENSHKVRS